ncbi:MAG: rRNA maturation RNase YbeY, partial [Fimbriimonadales bacterium]|nr:rRNA maturation RNase YbeY [Fimbriimonadales bacterium]
RQMSGDARQLSDITRQMSGDARQLSDITRQMSGDARQLSNEVGQPSIDPAPFGDIAISFETAQRQAALNQHDLLTELLMLALHGTLHLMGYDDSTETERAVMNARAASTLRRLGYAAHEEWYSRYEDA